MYKSEAFSVHDWGSRFVKFGSGDPHGLESWEGGQNWSTDPDQELSFLRSQHLDFHGWGGEGSHLFAQSFWDAGEHGCSTAHHDVRVQIFSNVHITFKNWLISNLVEPGHLLTDLEGLEQGFGASELLASHIDCLAIWKLIWSVVGAWIVFSHLWFVVESNVAELLLDVSNGFNLGRRAEIQSDFVQQFSHVFG